MNDDKRKLWARAVVVIGAMGVVVEGTEAVRSLLDAAPDYEVFEAPTFTTSGVAVWSDDMRFELPDVPADETAPGIFDLPTDPSSGSNI